SPRLTVPTPRTDNRSSCAVEPLARGYARKAGVHAHHPQRQLKTSHAVTHVRRLSGPVADELFVLCRPAGTGDAGRQAEAVYRALGDALAAEGLGIEALMAETVFCRRGRGPRKNGPAAPYRPLP